MYRKKTFCNELNAFHQLSNSRAKIVNKTIELKQGEFYRGDNKKKPIR